MEGSELQAGAERVEVTAADRDRAERIVGSLSPWRDHLAAALAEERAKARAPFLIRARECELQAEVYDRLGNRKTARAFRVCAQRIRRAAEVAR